MTLNVVVTDGGEGWLTGEVPTLPGCISQGRTLEELRINIREAIQGWLEVEQDKVRQKVEREARSSVEAVTV